MEEEPIKRAFECSSSVVIESDYSAALTVLLRYPVPETPPGPPSFVEDAVYLQRHLSVEGGKSIIARYNSDSASDARSSTGSKRGKRVNRGGRDRVRRSPTPILSPSKFLQDQGGIEGIIQEAARGVYSRGEKWGVAKALRGAYQGLQSASSTPSKPANAPRWSLDTGNMITDDSANLVTRIHGLEQRNQALAKLLERAMEDLWVQQREFTKVKADVAADALSLAIAKVQFVQVYLENSSMPLPAEDQSRDVGERAESSDVVGAIESGSPNDMTAAQPSPTMKPTVKDIRRKTKPAIQSSASQTPVGSPAKKESIALPIEAIPSINISGDSKTTGEPPRVRPALAQSSFSWILGEDQRKSDFVAASPFSTERERARGKAGFLFGDDKAEDHKARTGTSKGRQATDSGDEEAEAITLGALNAAKREIEQ